MKFSVRNILVTVFAVLSVTVMGVMSQQLMRQIETQRISSQLAGLASLDKSLFDALLGMRGERGAISSALKLEPADMGSTRKNIENGRRDLNAAFNDVKSTIDKVEPASLKTSLNPVLENYAKWIDLRANVDAALALPVKDRNASVGKSALGLADQMLVDLEKASYQVEAIINARGPAMIMFTQLRSLAWTSRTQLGTANSSIVGAIISQKPLSAEKLAEIAVQDARVFLAWDVISQIVASEATPAAITYQNKN